MTNAVFLIFGATGDLARRKLFPAFYSLYRERKLGDKFAVVGLARRPRSNAEFRQDVLDSIKEFARYNVTKDEQWESFAEHFEYMSLDINNVEGFRELRSLTDKLDAKFEIGGNRLSYLALSPELFGSVSHNLKAGGLQETGGWHRLVIEKPFGYDLKSAEKLNAEIRQVFDEKDIYRIDHYLGKRNGAEYQRGSVRECVLRAAVEQ